MPRSSTLIVLLFSLAAAADNAPLSVWEQMRLKGVSSEKSTVQSVEVTDSTVIVGYKTGDTYKESELCRDAKNEPFFGATFQNQRIQMLREAAKTGEKVELSFSGPWSPCLQAVKVSAAK